jgi:hypothetical protein
MPDMVNQFVGAAAVAGWMTGLSLIVIWGIRYLFGPSHYERDL